MNTFVFFFNHRGVIEVTGPHVAPQPPGLLSLCLLYIYCPLDGAFEQMKHSGASVRDNSWCFMRLHVDITSGETLFLRNILLIQSFPSIPNNDPPAAHLCPSSSRGRCTRPRRCSSFRDESFRFYRLHCPRNLGC